MTFNKIFFLLAFLFVLGCSTKKNTWVRRNYHNLTAHYNVYFNGNESYKEGIKAIQDGNHDDYTRILPLFPDSKESSKDVASSQMDRAIEKGTKLIKKHSIRKKPKKRSGDQSIKYQKFISQNEFNKWVDNAYLLIGKAHFYKHEYYMAQQSFAYMFREYQPGPEWYEAEIYNARAAIELGDFAKAKILLDNYDLEGKAPDKLYGLFASVYADYYLRQEQYDKAVPYLEDAISGAWSRYYKLRFTFVLAQVYHTLKKYDQASNAYLSVIKKNPPYEMAFNAKVNRASVMFGEGGLPAVRKEITKLLRDKRNKEYCDQIYYALAMAYKSEKQEEEAIDNFQLSIDNSIQNEYQKGLSFYELANLHYARPEYRPAYNFLDSAMISLNENFPKYDEASELHEDLETLVGHINTVEREDSLQRIAAMSEKQRTIIIEDLIAQEKKRQEDLKKQQEDLADNGDFFYNPTMNNNGGRPGTQGAKWYFYNPTSVGMGKMEFEKRWGRRKLEDNWRRTNKEVVSPENTLPGDPDDFFTDDIASNNDSIPAGGNQSKTPQTEGNSGLLNKDTYLKDLPLTEGALKISKERIEESLISMAIIYKDEIENIPYAIDALNELLKRFPNTIYKEDALMNLYLCYEIQGDQNRMSDIRKQIIEQYPDGEFTAFLNDPDFFKKREERRTKIENLYQEAYSEYLYNNFSTPIENYRAAKATDEDSELLPKFKFLAGLSYAKAGQLAGFESELKEVVTLYPESEVTPLAKAMLDEYGKGRTPVQGPTSSNLVSLRSENMLATPVTASTTGEAVEDAPSSFIVDNKAPHSLIMVINPETDLNRLRFNIADYNFSKFLLNDYEMGLEKMPDGTPVFRIKGFNNRLEALDYFYSIRERKEIFEVKDLTEFNLFAIHDKNLEFLLSSGDKTGYEDFFRENYLSAEAFKNSQEEEAKTIEPDNKPIEETEATPALKEEKIPSAKATETTPRVVEEKQANTEIAKEAIKEKVAEPKEITKPATEDVIESTQAVAPPTTATFEKTEGTHAALVLFKKGRINIQRTGTAFKNYTKSNFGSQNNVEFGAKGTSHLYILVEGFGSEKDAKDYLQKINLNNYLMREISRMEHYLWAITPGNYKLLKNEESYNLYNNFYKKNY